MNIFILDRDPAVAAQFQCDKHVVKMILESAQMMATIARKQGVESRYKSTHANHPCTVWAGKCKGNYEWLSLHALALCEEYTHRYSKIHKSQEVIEDLLQVSVRLPSGSSEFVQCVPDEHKDSCAVKAYQKYYNTKTFAKWSKRSKPTWYKGD
jgi:hypothetical protein